MKIIIPTNDRHTIAVHLGRCLEFAVYYVCGKNIITRDFVKNHHSGSTQKGCRNNPEDCHHQDMLQLFSGADFIVHYTMGKKLKQELDENGIIYIKARSVNLEEIVKELLIAD